MPKLPEIDAKIFQDLTNFYGKLFDLPPLAAKIYAFLLFDFERAGVGFDELVKTFSASKSSVSTSLASLMQHGLIRSFTKIDERKRFFTTDENYMKIRFENVVKRMREELKILENLQKLQPGNDRFEIYKDLLNKNITNIDDMLAKV